MIHYNDNYGFKIINKNDNNNIVIIKQYNNYIQ